MAARHRYRYTSRDLRALDLYQPYWFGAKELAERLQRTERAVKAQIALRGKRKWRCAPWTAEEDATLLEIASKRFYKQEMHRLPCRSFNAAKQRLCALRKRQTVCR